jgi:lactate dehydrogenase-like 2-hydroxyacid dehydrogenase
VHYLRFGKYLATLFPLTETLRTRSMGILGLNRNGKAIAKRDEAFGLKIAFSGCSRQL